MTKAKSTRIENKKPKAAEKDVQDQESNKAEDLTEEGDQQVDLYQEMGVNSAATTVEIKSAYRKLALKYHPGTISLLTCTAEHVVWKGR